MIKGKSSKSWKEKLEKEVEPKVVDVPDNWARQIGHGKMLVPSPLLVDKTIKKIPQGKLATVNTIRNYLADEYKADMTCPLTTGIFLNIVANVAGEERLKGKFKITPWWRVLKEGGMLNSKFPGGIKQHMKHLKREGFDIIKGKANDIFLVNNYEKKLAKLI